MKINQDLAVSTDQILLVPYDAHHVGRYHRWMQDEDLREATASDLLTLEEEYENQQSWRTAHDKLTFIICQPATTPAVTSPTSSAGIFAGEDDIETRMVGDVNLFLTRDDDNDDEEEDSILGNGDTSGFGGIKGEIDIMIAAPEHRRKGHGEAAVRAFLWFLGGNLKSILDEYAVISSSSSSHSHSASPAAGNGAVTKQETNKVPRGKEKKPILKKLVAKINAENQGSIRLFENLGFRRDGEVNYFGEVSMVLVDFLAFGLDGNKDSYRECFYDRSQLKN
ncbi:acetyltransferase domain-containing protein [Xylaria arbuscula]|nr:acetyltransferase domain-containing protein [Xylaria arbuscula]